MSRWFLSSPTRLLANRRWWQALPTLALVAGVGAAQERAAQERVAQERAVHERPRLVAYATALPVLVDGILDDSAWQAAEKGSEFWQRDPDDGAPATERTEFQIAYTATMLFVAIRAWDSQPETLVAMEMERDGDLYRDESVAVLLDTFHDRRNAYCFETNPNGARRDVLVSDEERELTPQWDGVWSVASRRDPEGWTAEFAIPLSTLRFDPARETWGLNVRRMIRHKNEEANWAHIDRGSGSPRDPSRYAFYRVSLAGELTGLEGLVPSRSLALKPFVVAGATDHVALESRDQELDLGLDAKWGLSRSLNLDLTYNTDFAEVEVDQQQVNLTRFSLFFPEKREFFLENAGIFEFGLPNRDPFEPVLMKPFFSRRIGLDAGREVPIELGARLTGRIGGWNLGVLEVTTEETGFQDGSRVGASSFTVIRAKRNLGRRSGIGLLMTRRDDRGGDDNRVVGVDLDWKPDDHWDFAAFVADSSDQAAPTDTTSEPPIGDQDSWAAGYGVGYQKGDVRASFDHSRVSARFDPASGFLLRSDYERLNPRFRYRPQVNRFGIRSWFLEALVDRFERASTGELESETVSLSALGWRSMRDDGWSLNWVQETEQLFRPFEIRPGIVIPAGRYRFDGWRIGGRTNEGRRVNLRGRFEVGDFYDGERIAGNVSVNIRASRFFRAETSWSLADVSLPQGDFVTNVFGERLSVSVSPTLRVNTFVQYNDEAELVAANVRFNWLYRPGSDLYLVFNQSWDAASLDDRRARDRQVIVKFTYLVQR